MLASMWGVTSKNRENGTFAPAASVPPPIRRPAGIAKGRHIVVAAVSPRKNTSKTAPFKAELGNTPGFSTTFSTVVEILGKKPKVSLPDDCTGGVWTRDCSTGILDTGFVIGVFESVQYYWGLLRARRAGPVRRTVSRNRWRDRRRGSVPTSRTPPVGRTRTASG